MLTRKVLIGMSIMFLSSNAQAANLVTNGDFEQNGGLGQITGGVSYATGWTSGTPTDATYAFNFIVDSTADSAGFPSVNTPTAGTNIYLWGPNTPVANGGPVANGFTGSPTGGDFMGMDGAYATAAISQTISGLVTGQEYELSFDWAASQFTDQTGDTTQSLQVTFGSDVVSTTPFDLPGKGFSGWMHYTTTFTAGSSSQILSFLAVGSPAGLPPFTLLDGISLTEKTIPPSPVPEPSSLALLGLGAIGFAVRSFSRRRASQKSL